jgi:hydrogenase nickel incorporation protein HypA/HybF
VHEMALVCEVLDVLTERTRGAPVRRVVLEIGRLSAVVPDAVRFCFDLAAEATVAENALLQIVETPGRAHCRGCDREVSLDGPLGRCECGGIDLDWISGQEFRIKEVEVA